MNTAGLLEYQGFAAEQLIAAMAKYGAAFDGSDMGVGKTYQAGAVLREHDLPTLVVCPAVSVTSWRRMGAALGVSFSILNYEMLRTGRTPFGEWEKPKKAAGPVIFYCNSCQMKLDPADRRMPRCPHHNLGIHCIAVEKKKHNYGKFIWNSAIKRLVFDEAHRCAAIDSLQADMLVASKRQRIPTLSLSATLADSPLDFRALGYSLGLHNYMDFYGWAAKHGCRKTAWGGFQFLLGEDNRKRTMAELHKEIFPERGTRVRIADLGDKFPAVQITAELCDLDKPELVDSLYARMDEAIRLLNSSRGMGDNDSPLTSILRARQELELLKVPIFEELARDALASGSHVAFFVNYRQTVDELCKRFKTQCRIDGSQRGVAGAERRRVCIENFLGDDEPVIVCSAAAGGVSVDLHDLHGNFPRLGLISPGFSSREFRQVFGRLRRAGAKTAALYRVLFVAGSVEEKIHKALSQNLNQMDALNDADLLAANLPLTHVRLSDLIDPFQD